MKYLYLVLALILGTYNEAGGATAEDEANTNAEQVSALHVYRVKSLLSQSSAETSGTTKTDFEEVAASEPKLDIKEWDNAEFLDVVEQILPADAFGGEKDKSGKTTQYSVVNVVKDMCDCFVNRGTRSIPHIAIMRVVIDTENNKYIFPIPYIFASGLESHARLESHEKGDNNAITKWNNFVGEGDKYQDLKNALRICNDIADKESVIAGKDQELNCSGNLDTYKLVEQCAQKDAVKRELFRPGRHIGTIVKCIGDYKFSALSSSLRNYAHSERAAILCLLDDHDYSLKKIIEQKVLKGNSKLQVTIQIKTIEVVCGNCRNLLNNKSCYEQRGDKFLFVGAKDKDRARLFNFYDTASKILTGESKGSRIDINVKTSCMSVISFPTLEGESQKNPKVEKRG